MQPPTSLRDAFRAHRRVRRVLPDAEPPEVSDAAPDAARVRGALGSAPADAP